MTRWRRDAVLVGVVVLLGAVALFESWIGARRPSANSLSRVELQVTSAEDRGPGTLREAIFEAVRIPHPVHISLQVERIAVRTPLPPVANAKGVTIAGADGVVEIDASGLGRQPLLTLGARGSRLTDLRLVGSLAAAVVVSQPGVEIERVEFERCETAIRVDAGAEALSIRDSVFTGNGYGVILTGFAAGTRIAGNRFREHREAAIWAVMPPNPLRSSRPLTIEDNAFKADRIGVVAGNLPARIRDNEFVGALESAVTLFGSGARVMRNRIRDGHKHGLVAIGTIGLEVSDNELDHNPAVAVLLNAGSRNVVHGNRIYENGYGIVSVFAEGGSDLFAENSLLGHDLDGMVVVGGSPVVRANRAVGNRSAGLRVLDYLSRGRRRPATPFLDGNTLRSNGVDGPLRGVMREPDPEVSG